MMSFKSLGKFMYVFYYGMFCMLAFAMYMSFGVISVIIMKSKDVLFISNIVSFHKVIFLLLLFFIVTWLLLKLFLYIYEFTGKFEHLKILSTIVKKMIFASMFGFIGILIYYFIGRLIGNPFEKNIIEMNVLGIIVFLLIINMGKYFAVHYTETTRKFLGLMLIALFLREIISISHGNVSVEFSSIAYLCVPTIFLTRIKKFYGLATFIGILAGTVYYTYIIINGGATYNVVQPSQVYISMFAHGTLLLVGFVSMLRLKFNGTNYLLIFGYMISNIVWAIIKRPDQIEFRLFIYELIDGNFLNTQISSLNPFIYSSYFIILLTILFGCIKLFYILNKKWDAKLSYQPI